MNRQHLRIGIAVITIVITSAQSEAQVVVGPGGVPVPAPNWSPQIGYAQPAIPPRNMPPQVGYAQPAIPARNMPPQVGYAQPAVYAPTNPYAAGGVVQASCDCGGCDGFAAPPCQACGGHCGGACGLGQIMQHMPKMPALPCYGPECGGGCCLPRWFDVHAEALYWKREDIGASIPISVEGLGTGNVVLSTDDLDLDYKAGFRITGSYNLLPGIALEGTYFGMFDWSDAAGANSDGNLLHIWSLFGQLPAPGVGFPDVDFADLHRIDYSSELHNAELNFRQRWVSANCVLHGSWLAGVRYVSLSEDFINSSFGDDGAMTYGVKTDNDMFGLQLGGELYACLTPRLKVGADIDAGVYTNRARQRTDFFSTVSPGLWDEVKDDDVAFVGEASVIGLFRLTPRFTVRGGYQAFYLDGVALGTNNFNIQSPFALNRTPFLDNSASALYHGANLGFEFIW